MGYKGFSDFRSDTVTRPTEEMRKAMYEAEVGDDVLGDDPTVKRLEELAADITGKEAGLFVPSGTMGNTIAVKLGSKEGTEIILEEKSHIYNFEAANMARYASVMPRPVESKNGRMKIEDIKGNIKTVLREHMPSTSMICLENTHNYWGGAVLPVEYIEEVKKVAKKSNLHLHLDGARVFNAATALKVGVKEITKHFDSVMFCLSKGLCAPVGSMLVGSREFIKNARILRKSFGGGMRQVGILAAAGIISIEKMTKRLEEDHIRARKLAEGIADLKGLTVDLNSVQTNFVMVELKNMNSTQFLDELKKEGVLALPFSETRVRFVTHNDIDDNDVERAIKAIRKMLK
ncbi:threonine aldolase [Thermotomaculum hydrothermale]|uniref:Threonine aldolase n=1 Tax=Thermotomaculum hydrothermale TaxID=981385 RepID=A0A7R6SZ49_9BACT|nr:GntG family PLP-dependent aldolase [Thermotomaculum hydrothermale]BBB33271.1 threonine aldolase [Thermotomaculum hydrothermale]